LSVEQIGDQLRVIRTPTATFGVLQSAPSVNGPWTEMIGALSGQFFPVTSEAQFFRIAQQSAVPT
jgi:hypothetical protein